MSGGTSSVNLVILLGNVGKDPIHVQGKKPGINFTLATTYRWGKEDNQKETTWHNISFFAPYAYDIIIGKGDLVHIIGRIRTSKGKDDKIYTSVIADKLRVVSHKGSESSFIPEDEEQASWFADE